jgi:acetyltransferase-like isoleucine patch superfamily enzyme
MLTVARGHKRLRGLSHRGMLYILGRPVVTGPPSRVKCSANVGLANVMINTVGGFVDIAEDVFFGHDVMLLTGTHDFRLRGRDRQINRSTERRDIIIESGAWIASRAIILGPCRIGRNAVIGCGCIVDFDVPDDTIVRLKQEILQEPIVYRNGKKVCQ